MAEMNWSQEWVQHHVNGGGGSLLALVCCFTLECQLVLSPRHLIWIQDPGPYHPCDRRGGGVQRLDHAALPPSVARRRLDWGGDGASTAHLRQCGEHQQGTRKGPKTQVSAPAGTPRGYGTLSVPCPVARTHFGLANVSRRFGEINCTLWRRMWELSNLNGICLLGRLPPQYVPVVAVC